MTSLITIATVAMLMNDVMCLRTSSRVGDPGLLTEDTAGHLAQGCSPMSTRELCGSRFSSWGSDNVSRVRSSQETDSAKTGGEGGKVTRPVVIRRVSSVRETKQHAVQPVQWH